MGNKGGPGSNDPCLCPCWATWARGPMGQRGGWWAKPIGAGPYKVNNRTNKKMTKIPLQVNEFYKFIKDSKNQIKFIFKLIKIMTIIEKY